MPRKPRSSGPREVFFSHAGKDRRAAERIASVMRFHGVPVWYSATDLLGAQQWHDEIGDALARCDWFAVLLSPAATRSIWVKRELLYALEDRRYQGRIIPILYRRCELAGFSWTLSAMQNVNFVGSFELGCRSLLRIWGIGYKSA